MKDLDQKIYEITDSFFVVDGKEHLVSDLNKSIKSLIKEVVEEVLLENPDVSPDAYKAQRERLKEILK